MTRLTFQPHPTILNRKTNDYSVYNQDADYLGDIKFYNHWRKHVWVQDEGVYMDDSCLEEVISFLQSLKK